MPKLFLGGLDNISAAPDEGIMIDDDDIDTEDGSDSNGEVLYEIQHGSIMAWTTSKIFRENLKKDLITLIESSNENVIIVGITPTRFIDYFAIIVKCRRLEV